VSRRFTWRSGGPVQKYIHQKMLREFFAGPFAGTNEEFFFHGGAISEKTLGELKRALRNASRECVEIVEGDRGSWDTRFGAAFVSVRISDSRRGPRNGHASLARPSGNPMTSAGAPGRLYAALKCKYGPTCPDRVTGCTTLAWIHMKRTSALPCAISSNGASK